MASGKRMQLYCTICDTDIPMSYDNDATVENVVVHVRGARHQEYLEDLKFEGFHLDNPHFIYCKVCEYEIRFPYYHLNEGDTECVEESVSFHVHDVQHKSNLNPAGSSSANASTQTALGVTDFFWCSVCPFQIPSPRNNKLTHAKLKNHLWSVDHNNQVSENSPGFILCSICDCRIPGSYCAKTTYKTVCNHINGSRHTSKLRSADYSAASTSSSEYGTGGSYSCSTRQYDNEEDEYYEDSSEEDSYSGETDSHYTEYSPELSDEEGDYIYMNGNVYPEDSSRWPYHSEAVSSLYLPD